MAKRADSIVKGMLEHSRTSTGQKELTDINELADEYLRLGLSWTYEQKTNLSMQHLKLILITAVGKINIIPQDIGRVILNLINNAFYAVDEKRNKNG